MLRVVWEEELGEDLCAAEGRVQIGDLKKPDPGPVWRGSKL